MFNEISIEVFARDQELLQITNDDLRRSNYALLSDRATNDTSTDGKRGVGGDELLYVGLHLADPRDLPLTEPAYPVEAVCVIRDGTAELASRSTLRCYQKIQKRLIAFRNDDPLTFEGFKGIIANHLKIAVFLGWLSFVVVV